VSLYFSGIGAVYHSRIIIYRNKGVCAATTMKKKTDKRGRRDDLRQEYDLCKLNGGVRGKYSERYRAGTNLVPLSPDVAGHLPGEPSVSKVQRTLIHAAKAPARRAR
jgi:hypothetical protein